MRIAEIAKSKGIKWAYIARKLGVSEVTIWNKMHGRTEWKVSEIKPLAEALGETPETILNILTESEEKE